MVLFCNSRSQTSGFLSLRTDKESQEKLEKLVDGLAALINNANDIIGDTDNKENIKTSLSNLAEASERAERALEKFEKFFAAAIETSEELSKATAQLRVILGKVNEGQGTAAMLVNDGRLYENLLENTEQMKVLLEELEAIPNGNASLKIRDHIMTILEIRDNTIQKVLVRPGRHVNPNIAP